MPGSDGAAVTSENQLRQVVVKPDIRVAFVRTLHAMTAGFFGRGYTFALRTAMRVVPNSPMNVEFSDGSRFRFNLDDFYWNRLVLKDYQYEPELAYALGALRDIDYVFLDCGANIGYWSVLVSSEPYGRKRAIAVEASPETFVELRANCDANGSRFTVLNNALYHEDGKRFDMTVAVHHSARQIDTDGAGGDSAGEVVSITVDTLLSSHDVGPDTPVVIKLDVEGQEINALKGAVAALERDALVIYEDHAKDREHEPTRFVMDELGLEVFYVDEQCAVRKIENVAELDEIKSDKGMGYNFFTCGESSVFNEKFNNLIN